MICEKAAAFLKGTVVFLIFFEFINISILFI